MRGGLLGSLHSPHSEPGKLTCPRCGFARPPGCEHCGASRFRLLRAGVSRVREELEALLREPVGELTAAAAGDDGPAAAMPQERVVVGTEAALHRIRDAGSSSPSPTSTPSCRPPLRGGVAGAAPVGAGRPSARRPPAGARLLLQTRLPGHPVVGAVLHADPARAIRALAEQARRLRLPPFAAFAELAGAGAGRTSPTASNASGSTISGPVDGRYLVRAADGTELADGLGRRAGRRTGSDRGRPGALTPGNLAASAGRRSARWDPALAAGPPSRSSGPGAGLPPSLIDGISLGAVHGPDAADVPSAASEPRVARRSELRPTGRQAQSLARPSA